jgi:DNA-binding response OmpR family regulator
VSGNAIGFVQLLLQSACRMPFALVIEDDSISASVVAHVLERKGYTTLSTVDPKEATRLCREFKIDVIIADLLLHSPFSGTDVALTVRRECEQIPVLFVSGTPLEGWSESDLSNIEALLPGRVEFLMKPFTAADLLTAVAKLLHRSYSELDIRSAVQLAKSFRQGA